MCIGIWLKLQTHSGNTVVFAVRKLGARGDLLTELSERNGCVPGGTAPCRLRISAKFYDQVDERNQNSEATEDLSNIG